MLYYSVTQAAKILKYSVVHVRRMCVSGEIKAKKIGNQWVVSQKSLYRYCIQSGIAIYKCGHYFSISLVFHKKTAPVSLKGMIAIRKSICPFCEQYLTLRGNKNV